MLMRNPDYQTVAEQALDSSNENDSSRKMLLGHVALLLLFAIAILLRSLSS